MGTEEPRFRPVVRRPVFSRLSDGDGAGLLFQADLLHGLHFVRQLGIGRWNPVWLRVARGPEPAAALWALAAGNLAAVNAERLLAQQSAAGLLHQRRGINPGPLGARQRAEDHFVGRLYA